MVHVELYYDVNLTAYLQGNDGVHLWGNGLILCLAVAKNLSYFWS